MTGLVYARARWYDASTGTFLSPDPLGYRDSSNLYAFGAGDPVNNRDPLGEGIGEWLSKKYNAAADAIDETVGMVMEGTDDSQWFTRSAAQTMQLASGFLRSGTQSGVELAEGNSAWQVVQNRVYEGMPLEEARALIQDWDYLSDADKARLISMGISKTAGVIAGARGVQQTVYTPKPIPLSPRPASGPYNPRAIRAELEAANPEGVTSSTVPPTSAKNVALASRRHPISQVVFDERGFPIFDDISLYQTKLPQNVASVPNRLRHAQTATQDLWRAIKAGEVPRSQFTTQQLKAIEVGADKIPGLTWHHHQNFGRMQLIPEAIHRATGHVGGFRLWY